ncbi:hypothetical protein CAOG_06165 [Capsaspora owczarzaki ATCC 30864]|uniref:G-protein coupled receptors family 1 profile domain-containing protein n=1 Tax=Capsaspora owczarzaki (strain ATCC 30864) TaxID=595528 RepID=A0A0D2WTF9_CAPO3|nr:hypothetical protein CAOG_06165 [Capsaspora owczarzaki ATCC 30864]KJE95745.1 hypothetical protein CAOG_006165 [Capsaspora owczarzaki ATCC 30864]|eukprot:XP_004345755.1 hypothetical protein CAOG_06165 [Capsaspora owczarzaki ATCC 30864]
MSDHPPNENCSFPMTGPNCTETFADSLGGSFVAVQATLATVFVLMTVIGLIGSYRLTKKTGFCLAIENAMTYCATFCCLIGAIRQVDANGWRDVYPLWVAMLLYDLGTSAALNCWLLVVHSWAVFVCRAVVSRRSKLARIVKHVYVASVVYAWVSQPFATMIEFVIEPIWIGKVTHYGLSLVLFAVWVGGGSYFATIIHRVLVEAQRRYGDISTAGSNTANHAPSTDAKSTTNATSVVAGSTEGGTTTMTTATGKSGTTHQETGTDYSRVASKRRRLAVRRIQRMNILVIILEIIALLMTAYSIFNWLSNKWSVDPPNVIPLPTAGDILVEHLFDILHLLVCAAVFWFYRVTRSKGDHGASTAAGPGHASATNPSGATHQTRDPESLEDSIGEEEVSESTGRSHNNRTSRRGSTQHALTTRQSQSSMGFVGGDSVAWAAPPSSK